MIWQKIHYTYMSSLKNKKIALVYDRVNKWGGAERILQALRELFPGSPLYTAVYNAKKAPWANVFAIKPSFLQKIPLTSGKHELLPLLTPVAFENFNFDKFDIVISVTSEAAKGLITKPSTRHICYCLTPTRYLWSGYGEYFKNPVLRTISKPAINYLRNWDKVAAHRPDFYIAISKEVQRRIKEYYGKESEVVYPPVQLSSGDNLLESDLSDKQSASEHNKKQTTDYFLVVSRLVPYKRIDIAIKACNDLNLTLKIIGTGSDEKRLKSLSGPTIQFLGNVTDKDLVHYYTKCRALIFPGFEDFGLVMAEAQSFGKPVIAFKAGGALEIIKEKKTGIFFMPQTSEALANALNNLDAYRISSKDCIKQAQNFSKVKFKQDFLKAVERLLLIRL